jgi:hypothetical protein
VASGEVILVWRVSSISVAKRRVVVVGVGGGEISVKGGRNVIVEEGEGVGAVTEGGARVEVLCARFLEGGSCTFPFPLSMTGAGVISPSSSPIQHKTSAT